MPKASNAFQGGFHQDDPRLLITAAGGCTWPTVPAHRYLCVSTNATGHWQFLNTSGFLIQYASQPSHHDDVNWNGYQLGFPLLWAVFRRRWFRETETIQWDVQIQQILCYIPAQATFTQQPGKCNGEIPLGAMSCVPADGSTGSGMKLIPVQFDKTAPEDPWPPT